jgi:hypothetical protein
VIHTVELTVRQVLGIREIINDEAAPTEDNAPQKARPYHDATFHLRSLVSASFCEYVWLGATTKYLVSTYEQRIDPILKVIHIPSLRKLLLARQQSCDSAQQAIVSAVQFSAASTLDDAECLEQSGEQKSSLCHTLRRQTEALLAATDLYTAPTLPSLQAFIVYLVIVSSFIWPPLT